MKIYALIDPRTGNPFYVGATKQELKKRLLAHANPFPFDAGKGIMKQREDLVLSIRESGFMPEIKLLAECDISEVDFYEEYFYLELKSKGYTLLQGANQFYYKKHQERRNQTILTESKKQAPYS